MGKGFKKEQRNYITKTGSIKVRHKTNVTVRMPDLLTRLLIFSTKQATIEIYGQPALEI